MLDEATARLERIYNTLEKVAPYQAVFEALADSPVPGTANEEPIAKLLLDFTTAMDDDFNTAGALGTVFELAREANRELGEPGPNLLVMVQAYWEIRKLLTILGIRPHRAKAGGAGDSEKLVDLLLQARQEARKAKLFALGDKIRGDLKALGYEVEDLPGGKSTAKKK
jgi:cysteinyl-tRNA synthetase